MKIRATIALRTTNRRRCSNDLHRALSPQPYNRLHYHFLDDYVAAIVAVDVAAVAVDGDYDGDDDDAYDDCVVVATLTTSFDVAIAVDEVKFVVPLPPAIITVMLLPPVVVTPTPPMLSVTFTIDVPAAVAPPPPVPPPPPTPPPPIPPLPLLLTLPPMPPPAIAAPVATLSPMAW
uniref:Uncharacterized protein n=1 Tax=Glossina morsitans morsitans TaxID=37546 RepID=A0A1B0FG56_GLOMM